MRNRINSKQMEENSSFKALKLDKDMKQSQLLKRQKNVLKFYAQRLPLAILALIFSMLALYKFDSKFGAFAGKPPNIQVKDDATGSTTTGNKVINLK